MNKTNKNLIIGMLLAIVVVMGVAYAAFSTTLTISSTANVSSSWNVAFDTTKTSGTGVVSTAGSATGGTISYSNNGQTATISATGLTKPGDSATYTLTIKNTGSIKAALGTPVLTGTSCTVSGLTCTSTSGHIKFTVTSPASSTLAASTGTTTMTVKAEFPDTAVSSSTTETASISVSLTATQSS